MKKILISLIVLLCMPTLSYAENFLVGFEDIPVMEKLTAAQEPDVEFDTPLGRIVEVYATGKVSRAEVSLFYAATLPALGWVKSVDNIYIREGERFALDFFGLDGDLTIRFTLAPNR